MQKRSSCKEAINKANVSHRFGCRGQGHMVRRQEASQGHDLSWPELVPVVIATAFSDTRNLPSAVPESSCLALPLI